MDVVARCVMKQWRQGQKLWRLLMLGYPDDEASVGEGVQHAATSVVGGGLASMGEKGTGVQDMATAMVPEA